MAAKKRLTELTVERARPVRGRRVELFDGPGGVPGLALRITERGVKSWALMYRVNGKQRRMTLGRYPAELGLAAARTKARAALEMAARGIDPAGDPAERRQAPRTVAAVAERYMELHVRRNGLRRAPDVERMLRGAVLPAWGSRPIAEISRADTLDLVDDIASRAPIMANRVQSLLKRLFAWAVDRGILEASPLGGMRPPAKERSRERVLTDPELAAVWRACDGLGWAFGPITRLLILTAARRSEVAGLRWDEIDLERGIWTKPAERVKSGRVHELPLPQAALDLIADLPIIDGSPFLFPARIGSGPASGFSGAKIRLDRLSGVAGWTHHDIRRSTASGLAKLGVQPHVIAEALGHSPAALSGVTARYNRYSYEREVRAALELWADHVEQLADGRPAKVVPLRA